MREVGGDTTRPVPAQADAAIDVQVWLRLRPSVCRYAAASRPATSCVGPIGSRTGTGRCRTVWRSRTVNDPVTSSHGGTVWCFFRTAYRFKNPRPALAALPA